MRQALSERLFVLMHRNALRATDFFRIPDDRTVEIGLRLHTTALTRDQAIARHEAEKQDAAAAADRAPA